MTLTDEAIKVFGKDLGNEKFLSGGQVLVSFERNLSFSFKAFGFNGIDNVKLFMNRCRKVQDLIWIGLELSFKKLFRLLIEIKLQNPKSFFKALKVNICHKR